MVYYIDGIGDMVSCITYIEEWLINMFLFFVSEEYEIATTTASTDDADTKENVWIVLEGRKGRSKELMMENKKKKFLRYGGFWSTGTELLPEDASCLLLV